MGQYYKIIFLAEKQDGSKEIIRAWFYPNRAKLMEHSYLNDEFLHMIEFMLSIKGMFYRSRLVWAGDYAEPEEAKETKEMTHEEAVAILGGHGPVVDLDDDQHPNLYQLCQDDNTSMFYILQMLFGKIKFSQKKKRSYLVNHTKKQFVHMRKNDKDDGIHPLPLLVSEGNGKGGGDYFGHNEELCGTWARDIISVDEKDGIPGDYTELVCDFSESCY